MFRPKPNGSYRKIDDGALALNQLNRLRLGISAGLTAPKIVEAHELLVGGRALDDNTPTTIFQFAVQIAEIQLKIGRDEEAVLLFTTIKESAAKLRNHELGNAILIGTIKACHRNNKFELALQLTEELTDRSLLIETHFQTAELARAAGQSGLAVRCLTQYLFPAIDQLEEKNSRIDRLLAAAELSFKLSLWVEAKLIVYKIIDQLSRMDYARLETTAILMAKLGLTDDAIHLLTDSWFRESFTEDPRYHSEQAIRRDIISRRFPRFADYLRG